MSIPNYHKTTLYPPVVLLLLLLLQVGGGQRPLLGASASKGTPDPKSLGTATRLATLKEIKQHWVNSSLADLRTAAEAGDVIAQCCLASRLADGQGIKQDFTEGAKWYRMAAEQGLAQAQFALGFLYEEGRGLPESHESAMDWVRKAAEQGYAPAQTGLGWLYENDKVQPGRAITGNYPVAAEWYSKSAEQGNAQAQFLLATLYFYGKLGNEQRSNCIPWYLKAAAQGYVKAQAQVADLSRYFPESSLLKSADIVAALRQAAGKGDLDAQFNLAKRLQTGEGVTKDPKEAFKWMEKAGQNPAESTRVADACYELALMYERGQGVATNLSKAWQLYQQAAAENPDAVYRVAQMFEQGTGLRQDDRKAADYYYQVATRGWGSFTSEAARDLINLFIQGRGLPEDRTEVARRLRGVRHVTLAKSQWQLGEIYYQGKLVPGDNAAAADLFASAAAQGLPEAQNRIGEMWARGLQGTPDFKEAVKWYRKAAVQGFAEAQFNLGLCHAKGQGGVTDLVEAWLWLQLAATKGYPKAGDERDALQARMTVAQLAEARSRAVHADGRSKPSLGSGQNAP